MKKTKLLKKRAKWYSSTLARGTSLKARQSNVLSHFSLVDVASIAEEALDLNEGEKDKKL
jgi:hypothetical protein